MDKAKAAKLTQSIFAAYPEASKLFVTTDEQVFFTENHATNHAKSLNKENPEVIPVDRGPIPVPGPDEEKETKEPAGGGKEEKEGLDPAIPVPGPDEEKETKEPAGGGKKERKTK